MTIKGIVMLLIFAAIIAAAIVYGIVRGRLRSGPMRRYYPQPDFTRRAKIPALYVPSRGAGGKCQNFVCFSTCAPRCDMVSLNHKMQYNPLRLTG